MFTLAPTIVAMTRPRCARSVVLTVFMLAAAGCSKAAPQDSQKAPSPQPSAPLPAPSPAATPVAPEPSAPTPAPQANCYSVSSPNLPLPLVVEWTTNGEVGVVNVGADDTLNVRTEASPTATLVAELEFDTRGIRATGQVCDLGGVHWYEVLSGSHRGWVNGKFIAPTLKPVDATAAWSARLGASEFATPSALVDALRAQLNRGEPQAEGRFETVLLGLAVRGGDAVAELRSCCALDDSVAGDQTTLRLHQQNTNWKLVRATKRTLCYRGVNARGDLCS